MSVITSPTAATRAAVDVLRVKHLGRADYQPVWHAMQEFTDQRTEETVDELWLVEHPPVFTQGQAGKSEHVLAPGDIPVVQVDRGGQVTFHGPGQIVAYTLIDIRRRRLGVRQLVTSIEQVIIETLRNYGVEAERVAGAPGIYVAGAKIAALGLRVRRGRTFHGLALNVDMDLEPFQRINPCGFEGLEVTQLVSFAEVTMREVEQVLINHIAQQLNYNTIERLSDIKDE
jgi:lipoyl(octanoyl) transferase